MGFTDNHSSLSLLNSIFLFVISCFGILYARSTKMPSGFLLNLLILFYFIPLSVLFYFSNYSTGFLLYVCSYLILLCFFDKTIKINVNFRLRHSYQFFIVICSFILILSFLFSIYYNGFKVKIDLLNVYELRIARRGMNVPSIVNYILSLAFFVGIVAFYYTLKRRMIFLSIALVFLQLILYSFGASKTQLFSLFLVILVYFFYNNNILRLISTSLVLLLLLSILEYYYLKSSWLTDFGTRRVLFVPGKISYAMFEFFEDGSNEFLYLRGSLLRFFGFEDPYAESSGFQRLIGLIYGGSDEINANTGVVGNDYAQFGWFSLLFYPILRIVVNKLFDSVFLNLPRALFFLVSILLTFLFISGAFFSVLLTNGVLLLLFLLGNFPLSTHENSTY